MFRLIFSRRRRDKHDLIDPVFEFFKIQRAVVLGRRKAETVIHQRRFTRLISGVHTADLRDRLVRLINDDQEIIPKIIHQRVRRLSRLQAGQITGIVLNAGAHAGFPQHFNVKVCPFLNPLCFQKFPLAFEELHLLHHILLDFLCRFENGVHRHNIMRSRKDCNMLQFAQDFSRQCVNLGNPVDLIPEKLYPDSPLTFFRRKNFQHIPANPEGSAVEIHIVAVILNVDQRFNDIISVLFHPRTQRNDHLHIVFRASDAVNAGYTGNHDNIPALRKR